MRLTCLTRSAIRILRSRQSRRRSSSSGVGALTIAHTRGSPRLYASSVRSSASPSILSVFARRRRREGAIEAGSTTWLSTFILQHTVNPEAVQSRFLNDDDRERFPSPRKRPLLELRKARQQRVDVPGRHAVLRHLLSAWRQRQVDLLSSNETNIATRSLRIAFGASGRSATVCMVVSRVGGRNLTLLERRSLYTSPMGS